jgi:hypothetical protein
VSEPHGIVDRAVVWNGDNIDAVRALLGTANPPQEPHYFWEFSNRDEIVGVWTVTGMEVARIGDSIHVGADGAPYVVEAAQL